METEISKNQLLNLPKADLHVHLDGSLRPRTIRELVRRGENNSFYSEAELEQHIRVNSDVSDLSSYLDCFKFILKYLQQPEVIERVAFELAEDSAAENIRYLEVRFSPLLHLRKGATINSIIGAALKGLSRAEGIYPIKTALIVCCLRELPPESSESLVRASREFIGKGLVGIDLAGDETRFPGAPHRRAFDLAAEAGLHITVHAGEVGGADSIREALDILHAERIGHGLHLQDNPRLYREVMEKAIPLEMCLTTNVHTKSVGGFASHPAGKYLKDGIRVTLNTDDRLISNTTLTEEFLRAKDFLSLAAPDFINLTLNAIESGFLPDQEKEQLKDDFNQQLRRQ